MTTPAVTLKSYQLGELTHHSAWAGERFIGRVLTCPWYKWGFLMEIRYDAWHVGSDRTRLCDTLAEAHAWFAERERENPSPPPIGQRLGLTEEEVNLLTASRPAPEYVLSPERISAPVEYTLPPMTIRRC